MKVKKAKNWWDEILNFWSNEEKYLKVYIRPFLDHKI